MTDRIDEKREMLATMTGMSSTDQHSIRVEIVAAGESPSIVT